MGNKDLLMSIKSIWIYRICNKLKTIEVRKRKPKYKPNFRVFLYCTKAEPHIYKSDINRVDYGINEKRPDLTLNGKIVGHCTCTEIKKFRYNKKTFSYDISDEDLAATCLTQEELKKYGKGEPLYGYVLKTVMLYAGPADITEAYKTVDNKKIPITVAPQSWNYIDGVGIV